MSILGIQGQLLEVSVIECHKLKDTEWISRQDPYVCLEYGSTKFRTRTCTDGGKNPVFQEKFVFNLIEGLREINVTVWNSNTITHDDFIGSGKVQLHDVLSRGYDDRAWSLQTKTGRYAGEIKLIMHYANAKANRPATSITASAAPQLHQPIYSNPPVSSMTHSYQTPAYALPPSTAYPPPPPPSARPPPPQPYPASSPYPAPYPSLLYPPPAAHSPHPPPTAHSPHPPATYPPPPAAYPPQSYPPPPQGSPYSHSGYYPGVYPPQRY